MIAFQFIPPTIGAPGARRIDLASLAGCFGEREDAAAAKRGREGVARIVMLILVLLGAIGDTMLVARREAIAGCLAVTKAVPAARAVTF